MAPVITSTPAVCIAIAGARVNRKMDVGAEVSWVPATSRDGVDIRTTFLLAAAQFRPWESQGFFVKGGMGMAFVRNFVYDETGTQPPITSKALGLSYAAGWAFRRDPIASACRCSARSTWPRSATSRPEAPPRQT